MPGKTMIRRLLAACVAVLLLLPQIAAAQNADEAQKVQKFIDSLHFQTGTVPVPNAHATLKLTPEFRYLGPGDAQRVLSEYWGNPPDSDVLGMLVPTSASLADKESWAVVITYSSDGYVSDTEAAKIDYDQMLKDMQERTRDSNEERQKAGYPSIQLVGWAERPHYDSASNKLYWAKELSFGNDGEHTLNYDIRVLGRGGYLSLNAVAGMDQLPKIEKQMQNVLAMTDFDSGQRYSDFNSSTDKIAAYGIGALVAGAIAAKAGLFAKLLVMLLAFKKAAIAAFIAIAAAVKKFFGWRSSTKSLPPPRGPDSGSS
jgi:uncharacterized membrane-anchored protein